MQTNINFKVGSFNLVFSNDIKFETFDDPENYYGIIFHHNKKKYEVIECKLGTRLIISGKEGEFQDMPFNQKTCKFLPDFVNIIYCSNFNESLIN